MLISWLKRSTALEGGEENACWRSDWPGVAAAWKEHAEDLKRFQEALRPIFKKKFNSRMK